LVFVNPDPDARPLREVYPELDAITAQMELDFSRYHYVGASTYEVEANWKTWTENATECYHCATVHKSSFGAHYWDAPGKPIAFGERVIAGLEPYHGRSALLTRHGIVPSSDGQRFIYLWPSFIMGIEDFYAYPSTTIPLGPERTRFVSHGFVNDDVADDDFRREWTQMYDQTFKEDVEVVAVQQRGLRSGKVPYGQLSPVADRMTRQFHRIILDAYQTAMAR
jgi:phenylpropionate dioxygenase-like ring-hydroxylating dioxygenase large terminal subunit